LRSCRVGHQQRQRPRSQERQQSGRRESSASHDAAGLRGVGSSDASAARPRPGGPSSGLQV
jgi:hypothetical protein